MTSATIPINKRSAVLLAIVGLIVAVVVAVWLMNPGDVEERVRAEEVEVFDISEPPPPPPPVPEDVPQETLDEAAPVEQVIQADPLAAVQPPTTNPPAGDLNSLLEDPSGAPSAFSGGPRGQGGTGSGPLIGGTGSGRGGASRAYADSVRTQVQRHLRRAPSLRQATFSLQVRVRVSTTGALQIVSVSKVTPPEMEAQISRVLRSLTSVERPPPEGISNVITLQFNQDA